MTRPLFSILTPTYNTPSGLLAELVASVREQDDEGWELILVDDASGDPDTRASVGSLAAADPRITALQLQQNVGISGASNAALAVATGRFIVLLDHDDVLPPGILHRLRRHIEEMPTVDYLYTDECKLDADGRTYEPFAKPVWSPERLLGQNYTSHLSVLRRSIVEAVGGFDARYDGSQDHDLVLKVTERARDVAALDVVGYHWRAVSGSTALAVGEKDYTWDAGVAAVRAALERRGVHATAERGPFVGTTRIVREMQPSRTISLILTGPASPSVPRPFLAVDDPFVEVIDATVATGTSPEGTAERRQRAAARAQGSTLLFLDARSWIAGREELLRLAAPVGHDDIVMTGARLLLPDHRIASAGLRYSFGPDRAVYRFHPSDGPGYFNALGVDREVSAVPSSAAAVDSEAFAAVGGFATGVSQEAADLDLGAKLRARSGRVLTLADPAVVLTAEEPMLAEFSPADRTFLEQRWGCPSLDQYSP